MLAVQGALTTAAGALGSISLGVHGNRSWSGYAAGDFRSYGEDLSYNRNLSSTTTVGLTTSIERTDYSGNIGHDATLYRGQLTYSRQLNARLHIRASLGAVYVENEGLKNNTTFAGDASICRSGELDSLCLSLSRDAYSSVEGGVRTQTSAGLVYSLKLGPRDTLGADVSYGRSGALANIAPARDYLTADVTWNEIITQRLSGGIVASARGSTGEGLAVDPDYSIRAYLRFNLGSPQ